MTHGWVGVDFDGTLATYGTWISASHVGEPIAPMVERVKRWLAEGREVRIFTARIWPIVTVVRPGEIVQTGPLTPRMKEALEAVEAIQRWCGLHLTHVLPITCVKDMAMVELYDDRAVQVRPNTGEIVGHSTRGLL